MVSADIRLAAEHVVHEGEERALFVVLEGRIVRFSPVKRVAAAVSDGSMAIAFVRVPAESGVIP